MPIADKAQPDPKHSRIEAELASLRTLLLDALEAGKFVPHGQAWQPHFSGEMLHFDDHIVGERRSGCLVLAREITAEMVETSVTSTYHSYVLVGGWLGADVDLGRARFTRSRRGAKSGHYWAAFVLEDAILVTAGSPPSSCRLIGEVVNLQMATPFVQRRVCGQCHALNSYHATRCGRCGIVLTATGRLD